MEKQNTEKLRTYNDEQLREFVSAVRDASLEMHEENPYFYIVSLNGGLGRYDVLKVVDREFVSSRTIFLPGSSKIKDSAEVMTRCFENFFLEKRDETVEKRQIVSLDEVVSGNSVERLFNAYNSASRRIFRAQYGNGYDNRNKVEEEAKVLREKFPIKVYGIAEIRDEKNKKALAYQNRIKTGEVLEYPVKKIITMDELDYQPVEFAHPNILNPTGQGFLPKVKDIRITEKYINLLREIGMISGANPDEVCSLAAVQGSKIMSDCEKYSRKPEYK